MLLDVSPLLDGRVVCLNRFWAPTLTIATTMLVWNLFGTNGWTLLCLSYRRLLVGTFGRQTCRIRLGLSPAQDITVLDYLGGTRRLIAPGFSRNKP